ncbi:cellulose synthase subunit BcsC-related outer membrane protein [Raoultella ornithinolytica]|uniref:cellulose biosynthesis protein BcsC n=1 Tax=Klebsiella/Raoultella group TaxID=2890311 RepID=UPI000B5A7443|nr:MULTISPECIES: cellulose biosynthesis protein BcsC [Klebsiella/Raoultella group]MDM9678415.1 cellulose synthase subunit BcsC-related outer membrane protein [Raoultella planticola]MBK2612558.1 tetratricopeptide repeat protein [Raoultella ornithinolytica]MBZ7757458.1 tetratricopeptide repeat protein [Raoultella ornithinolytica]MCZ0104044.1 cellulose synthase subunit BcsC-related outer membrane protein [Raoultella ornithinolytica]MTF12682.1 tetratricopeptide repeat protein [Raoultella ornithino
MKRAIKMNSRATHRLSTFCLSGALTLGAFGDALAASNDAALQALFAQANYWHEKSHDELAMESLQKVLLVDANNTQALYLMALWAQQGGDLQAAAQWRARLAKTSPNSASLQELDNARKMTQVPQGQLSLARQQARSGNVPAALATWRSMFNGNTPPAGLAAEYYMTMASDKSLYPQALSELRQYVAQHPQENAPRVALGKALTWREDTRREGIAMLEPMASGSKDADSGLRQALLWLGPQSGDQQFYDTWMQRHPQDTEVQNYYRQRLSGQARGEGYANLNSGNTAAAKQQFEQVLQTNPQDADALAGMGYIAQRNGDFQAASQYLTRAADLGGDDSAARRQQAADALFYGQLAQAQQAYKQGNISQALALSAPLAQQSGARGTSAKLFRADVLRHNKDLPQAEQTLRSLLNEQPQNGPARESLYYVLREQNKTAEAQAMLRTLPENLQQKLQPRVVTGMPGDSLRRQAQEQASSGNVSGAIALLRQGVSRYPDDAWMRLDLARLLQKSGNESEAASTMAAAWRPGASSSSLYAAALYASENGGWQQAQTLLGRIPAASQTSQMRDLHQRVNYNLQLVTAQNYLAQGNTVAASNTLRAMAATPPKSPADVGKLARLLAQSGDVTTAVSLVRNNISGGISGNAGDYADQVTVLNQAGLIREAQNLLTNPQLQASSTPTQLASIRNGYVINEADHLREQGNYAAAYDKLMGAMQSDPQNTDLMFAMARLYQSGKMNKEAGVVYDYLMTRDTPDQAARSGAIDVALSSGDSDRAEQLAGGLRQDNSADRLLLLARVEEAQGHHQQAMTYLRSARGKLLGLQSSNSAQTPTVGGVLAADNPFVGVSRTPTATRTASTYGQYMPWQVSQVSAGAGTSLPGIQRPDLPVETAQTRMLRQVDTMMESLQEKTGSWLQGGMEVRGRDGESGTSKLTEMKTPLTWSSSPFGDSRFDFTVTPITLNAGTATGDAWRRYGANPLSNAVSNMISTATSEQAAIAAMTATEQTTYFASNPGAEALSSLGTLNASDFNATTSSGMENLAKLGTYDSGQVASYLASSNLKPNVDQASGSTDAQKANGVELALALSGDNYRVDIGSTPLGQDLNTVVGGVKWSPKLTNYLSLIFTGERRSLTDSLLSYVGLKDSYSGKSWGQVTKNGGTLQLSYDDGDAGFYVGGGGYSYIGDNVASNTSVNANAGVYLRPYRDEYRQLQTGLSMSYMDYSKNLSYFTYGQGGYFSPQNYVSVSLPVNLTEKYDNWTMKLGGSVGYQSYSQDKSAYFPTNSGWQQTLETAVANGFAKEAYYSATSKSGIGYTLRAGADYKVNKQMTLGGQVGYDTFGDYNESTAGLYIRYMLGDN